MESVWPEWIAVERLEDIAPLPEEEIAMAILTDQVPRGVNVLKVVLALRWYWPIVPQAWHGGVHYDAVFIPIAGYHCPVCKATFFESSKEEIMRHDCRAEAERVKSLN